LLRGIAGSAVRASGAASVALASALWRSPLEQGAVEPDKVKSVLVTKLYGIGNMIMLTPALQTLRRDLAEAKMILLTDGRAVPVIEKSGYFDHIVDLPPPAWKLPRDFNYLGLVARLRRFKPDLIITSYPARNPQVADIYDLLGARWSIGLSIDGPPGKFSRQLAFIPERHEVLCNLDLIEAAGLDNPIKTLRIVVGREHVQEAEDFLSSHAGGPPWFSFHCGSYPDMTAKRWPRERFAELGDRLVSDCRGRVVIVGDEQEEDLALEIGSMMKNKPAIAAGKLSILGTAALLRRSALVVSNDSGLMHLAAAMGAPVAALFGPTSHKKNAPWTEPGKSVIIRSDEECSPCFELGRPIDCDEVRCMKNIGVEQVMKEVERLLKMNSG